MIRALCGCTILTRSFTFFAVPGATQTTPPIGSPKGAWGERFHFLGLSVALPTLRRHVPVEQLLPKVLRVRDRTLTFLQSTKVKAVR